MSKETFVAALKSTVDKLVKDKSLEINVKCVDLDDNTQTPKIFSTQDSALVVEFGTLNEDLKDPLYSGIFHVGARTVNDPANYEILDLVGTVASIFELDRRIPIREEFGAVRGPVVGVLNPYDISVLQQNYDLTSNLRMVSVAFKAQRLIG